MNYTIQPVSSVDFKTYVDAFNEAYSDYFVPMHLSPAVMEALIYRENINLDRSVVAVNDNGEILGMGMLGVRDNRGWIGGMGVVPEYRRKGIGQSLMHSLIENAHALQLHYVDLEVITQNTPAYTMYEKLGFIKRRVLAIVERGAAPVDVPDNQYQLDNSDSHYTGDGVLELFDTWHDVANPWQRQREAIEVMLPDSDIRFLTDGSKRAIAFAIGRFSKERIQIIDAAISPAVEDRLQAAKTIFAGLLAENPKATSGMVNVGEDDMILQALQSLGFKQSLRQYEMRLVINEVEDNR